MPAMMPRREICVLIRTVILYPKTNNNEHRRAPALSSEKNPL
jgi:hypothetical protein